MNGRTSKNVLLTEENMSVMSNLFIKTAIEAIEAGNARRIDGVISINDNEYDYKAYLIKSVRPIIRIDILKKENEHG